jgi:hypothetical protein
MCSFPRPISFMAAGQGAGRALKRRARVTCQSSIACTSGLPGTAPDRAQEAPFMILAADRRGTMLLLRQATTSCWSDTGERLQFACGRRSSRETSGRGKCSSPAMHDRGKGSSVLGGRWRPRVGTTPRRSKQRSAVVPRVYPSMGLRHHFVLLRDKIAAAPRLVARAYEVLDDTAASLCARPAHNCKPAGTEKEDQAIRCGQ